MGSAMARIRASFPVLRSGGFATLLTGDTTPARGDNDVYAFLRSGGADLPVVAVVNKGSASETARIPLRGAFPGVDTVVDELNGRRFPVQGGAAMVTLPPRSGAILVRP